MDIINTIRINTNNSNKITILTVFEYGYKQKEVADFLGLYFILISRIIIEVNND